MIRHYTNPALVIVAVLTLIPLTILIAHRPIEVALVALFFAYVVWITYVVNLAVRLTDRARNGRKSR